MRAGVRTLTVLAAPLNAMILDSLREGSKKLVELRRETGHPAQTTLRAQLKKLGDAGLVEKHRRDRFPGVLEYGLSDAGEDLMPTIAVLERWLERSPEGQLELGSSSAKAAIRALTEGWSTTMLRALAAKPLTLTALDGLIAALNYPSLERRLAAMRLAGLVKARDGNGRGTPYGVTKWTRQGVAPLLAAADWERRHARAETAALARLDVETIFLLAAGLLSLPDSVCGSCRLAVELRDANGAPTVSALLERRDGHIVSLTTRLEGDADAWACGPLTAWLAALVERDPAGLELGGDCALAHAVIENLHGALFGAPVR